VPPKKRDLTDRDIRLLKPAARRYDVAADDDGLRLRVTPAGVKSWALRYRAKGTHRRLTIGTYPDLLLGAARKAAAKVRRDVALGEDPQAVKAGDREAMRMVDLLGESDEKPGWFLRVYVRTAGRLNAKKSATAIASDRYRIRKHLSKPTFLRKAVADVTPADLARIREGVPPGTWRQLRSLLHVVFEHAVELEVIDRNPVKHKSLKAVKPRDMTRNLSADERAQLEAAIADAEAKGPSVKEGISAAMARLFRLLALTGCRLSEIRLLRWEHVDLKAAVLRLPTSKTGARVVPITPHAVAFLRTEQKRDGVKRITGYVCPAREGEALDTGNVQRAWRSLRARAGLADVRLHDLRHAWASTAASLGVAPHVIMRVLGHKRSATLDRYVHPHEDAIRSGLEVVGDAIDRAAKGGKS
jgi:integrase